MKARALRKRPGRKPKTDICPAAKAQVPGLPLSSALRRVPGSRADEWPVRRLRPLRARQQAVPTPLRQTDQSPHLQAKALARPFRRRLEKIQPLPHGRAAGCLHRCGGEAAEPATPWPVGTADRTTVFDSQGIRSECRCKTPAARRNCESASIAEGYAEIQVRRCFRWNTCKDGA